MFTYLVKYHHLYQKISCSEKTNHGDVSHLFTQKHVYLSVHCSYISPATILWEDEFFQREESSLITLTFRSFLFFNHYLPTINLLNNGDVSWLDNNDNNVQLEAWMFLNLESDKSIFCYDNEMTFGSHRELIQPYPLILGGGKKGLVVESIFNGQWLGQLWWM